MLPMCGFVSCSWGNNSGKFYLVLFSGSGEVFLKKF